MANIYKQQQTSDLYNQTYSAKGNPSELIMDQAKRLDNMAEDYAKKAKSNYSSAVKIQSQNSMNDLLNNPVLSSNPEALGKEIDKVISKVSSEIVDNDVKADYLARVSIERSSYMNKAYANSIKVQNERHKSSLYNGVYAGIDSVGLSLSNGLTGTGSADDFVNASISDKAIFDNINAKDQNGKYIFSDTERRKMQKDYEDGMLNAFKNVFDGLTDDEKEDLARSVKYDNVVLAMVEGEEHTQYPILLEKSVPASVYKDIKKYANDEVNRVRSAKLREARLQKEETLQSFQKNPTEVGFEEVKKYVTDPEKLDKYEEILKSSPNYDAITNAETLPEVNAIIGEIGRISLVPTKDDENPKLTALDKSTKLIRRVQELNEQGVLSADDAEDTKETIFNVLKGKEFGLNFNLPDMSYFDKSNWSPIETIKQVFTNDKAFWWNRQDVDTIAKGATKNIYSLYNEMIGMVEQQPQNKDEIVKQYTKIINNTYTDAIHDIIKNKYWYIDGINDKLEPGKSVLSYGGEQYIFQGFTANDIFVKKEKE